MELGLGIRVQATGSRADVLVRGGEGACLGDVSTELLSTVLPPGRSGRLSIAGQAVAGETLLGAPPLLHGAVLQVDAAAQHRVVPAVASLHVVTGRDAGAVHRLCPGEVVMGREGAAIVLVDPEVSREHCRLRAEHDRVRVTDLGSTNGTTVDGAPVGPDGTVLPIGAVLRVGGTSLSLAAPAVCAPVQPTGDGRVAWNRPPRLRSPRDPVQVTVPAPPEARERPPLPVLAAVAPVALGVLMWRVTGSTAFLLFTLLSPVLVLGNLVTERRHGRRATRRQRALWQAQRDVADRVLAAAVRDDEIARRTACPDAAEVILTVLGPGPRLWERRRDDEDFLDLRVGLADQPAGVEADGELREGTTTARAVPVVVPLRGAGVLGLAGDRDDCLALARWVLCQAAVWHSPRDLQVVVLAEPSAAAQWGWTGWLPHTRPDREGACRALLGLDAAQATARVAELTALVDRRRAARGIDPGNERRVLVLLDGARALRTLTGVAHLLAEGPAVGVHAVCLETDLRLLPEECGATAVVTGPATVDVRMTGRADLLGASAELLTLPRAETVSRALAPLRDGSPDRGGQSLPESVRWTDTVGLALDNTDQDVGLVLARWAAPGRSTTAVLGRSADGDFCVDLSRDGPHALVAGTTGAGKSELLQTLLASLALANRPDELTFVLVDYKGGAAFGPCATLPHTVGMVTDLDGPLVERALTSLAAELSRREAVLLAHRVKDVEEHRRLVGTPGGPTEVLPRLVLVVDEFASLAEDLPDFVGGLVGIAMRGRSLGVHLVLATQRPEGVVSPDIRANTNLRLCLAVTRDTESRDVLDSPLAATISRTTPGRGYARTGHTDLTAFQTGRVGGARPCADAPGRRPTVELLPAAELGDPVARGAAEDDVDGTTDLALLVQACAGAAARLALPAPRSSWLPALPETVVLGDLPAVEDPWAGRPGRVPPLAYGLLDVPTEQCRRALTLDLDRPTHLMVVGSPRAGRTTVLRSLAGVVAAVASPDDAHLYAVDAGGGLAGLAALPHTGAVIGRDEPERLDQLLSWLSEEVERRQVVLAATGAAGLPEQRATAEPQDRLPHLLLLLDRWEAFLAAYQDLDGGRLVDLVHRLLREGPSAGLQVVLTADRSGLVGRIGSMVQERLLLRLADPGDYAAAGLPTRLVPATLPPGRGWTVHGRPLLAQVALLDADPSGPAQAAALRRLAGNAPAAHRPPRRFDPLPPRVHRRELGPDRKGSVLLGVAGGELLPVAVDLDHLRSGLIIGGPPGSGRSTTLVAIAAGLRACGLPVLGVAPRPSPLRELPGCLTDPDDLDELERGLAGGPVALLVDDGELLVDSAMSPVLERTVRQARDTGTVVVVAGRTDALVSGYRGFVVELRQARTGILLCPQSSADGDLLGVRLSRATGGEVQPGRGLLVQRGRADPLQVALPSSPCT